MDNLFYFGLLTGVTIMMAFLACVIVGPALMVFIVRLWRPAATDSQRREAFA